MFRFDNLLEDWACSYKPLSHDKARGSKDRAFYRVDTISAESDFVRNFATAKSPCMAYATNLDARIGKNTNTIEYTHTIYFLVKQSGQGLTKKALDDQDATECKYQSDELVQDLLAYLMDKKRSESGLKGLDIEGAEWATIPVKFNGWWICGLQMTQYVHRHLCVDATKYSTAQTV